MNNMVQELSQRLTGWEDFYSLGGKFICLKLSKLVYGWHQGIFMFFLVTPKEKMDFIKIRSYRLVADQLI